MISTAKTDFTILGMYVDRKRICSRMSESDVARICTIPADDVRRVICGKRISPESLHALCDWLERPISFFEINELATKREAYP
ncbi:hypothetical protein [Brucella rhizosphaerae]|uniref:hypothetical protein n=1 Tax=Brucella rhizosphaerae TaxID=571254 RepID=UPI000463F8A5|nr:hypothetical protein [Brucella rhizosphaerae]